ncbi:hypothetical protein KC349_g250 [Hortaea werneckii]|nr:hypothetical protein KC349_g250 [Hortaea werneckii]
MGEGDVEADVAPYGALTSDRSQACLRAHSRTISAMSKMTLKSVRDDAVSCGAAILRELLKVNGKCRNHVRRLNSNRESRWLEHCISPSKARSVNAASRIRYHEASSERKRDGYLDLEE